MKETTPRLLQKTDRLEVYNRFPCFPSFTYEEATDTDTIVFPKVQKTLVLCAEEAATFEARVEMLTAAICGLAVESGVEKLLFMKWSPMPWRVGKSSFPPAKEALQFLSKEGIDRQFSGGIYVFTEGLSVWIPHLMWLVRTSSIYSEIYFTDGIPQLLSTFCQYGNLHLSILAESMIPIVQNWASRFRLTVASSGCSDTGTGAIAGRQLSV